MKLRRCKKAIWLCAAIILGWLTGGSHVLAATVVFTEEAAWLTAVGNAAVTTETFESTPIGSLSAGTTDIGLFSIFIDRDDANDRIRVLEPGAVNGSREFQGDVSKNDPFGRGALVLDFLFDQPVVGFAGEFVATTENALLTLTVNGTTFEFDEFLTTGVGTGFLGVVDTTTSFSSVSFGVELGLPKVNEVFNVDNVQLATPIPEPPTPVPEPSTALLLSLGLVGVVGVLRKRRQQGIA